MLTLLVTVESASAIRSTKVRPPSTSWDLSCSHAARRTTRENKALERIHSFWFHRSAGATARYHDAIPKTKREQFAGFAHLKSRAVVL